MRAPTKIAILYVVWKIEMGYFLKIIFEYLKQAMKSENMGLR